MTKAELLKQIEENIQKLTLEIYNEGATIQDINVCKRFHEDFTLKFKPVIERKRGSHV